MIDKVKKFVKEEIKPFGFLFSVGVYVIFALIFTYPLILHITNYIIGDQEGDMWKHLWGFWWVKKRIFVDGVLPLFTDLLNYPYGGSLFFIDPLGALLSIPLQFFMPVYVAYNIIVIFDLVLGASSAYLLARYFVKNKAASFYTGTAFAFTSYMLAYITSGVSETFNFGWIPLFFYFYVRMLNEDKEYLAVLAGVTFFMTTLGSWYYGSFSTLLGMFYFMFYLYYQYKKFAKSKVQRVTPVVKGSFVERLFKRVSQGKKKQSIERFKAFTTKRQILSFKEMVLKVIFYIALVSLLSAVLYVLYLPKFFSQHIFSNTGYTTVMVFSISVILGSLIYLYWQSRSSITKFAYNIIGYFYSAEPKHIKIKMYILFGFYTLSFLGIYHIYQKIHTLHYTSLFSLIVLSGASLLIALLMTYMEVRGDITVAQVLKASRKSSNTYKQSKALTEYAKVMVPWLLLVLSFGNIIRIIAFYSSLEMRNILSHVLISAIIFVSALIYIVYTKVFLHSKFIVKLYISPDVPENVDDLESAKRKIISRNILATFVFLISIALPPVLLYFRGFSPKTYIKYWVLFTLALISISTLIMFLSKKPTDTKGVPSKNVRSFMEFVFKFPLRKLLIMSIVAMSLVGPLFYTFKTSLNVSQGLVKRERSIEFIRLYLSKRFHNVCRLIDYVKTGKENSVRTYTVDRLTRSSYAGWVTLVLALSSLWICRKRKYIWFWAFISCFFILFSLGPFLYVTENIHTENLFILYKLFYLYFPFFSQISIPYRFNIMAMLGLSMLAGYSISEFTRRWHGKERNLMAASLALACLFDVIVLSPGPYPIPLSELKVPKFYKKIAKDREFYGIIDIPFQRVKGELLCGEYFYYQMTHQKGIPYKVEGTIPVYIYENQFTIYLFNIEKGYSMAPPNRSMLMQYFLELKKNKIKYIVVHNQYLRPSAKERVHTYLRYFLGPPQKTDEDLYIYKVY